MRRRHLLVTAGTTLTAGLAGCSNDESDEQPEPEPEASELQISVENSDSQPHSVTFVLQTTREDLGVVEGFDSGDIAPGETWTREPEPLDAGEYDLRIEMPVLGTETTIAWVGYECPVKEIEIELRSDGFRVRDACPGAGN